jgi:uncharacterized membrane protein SpoIIM required for sporulation
MQGRHVVIGGSLIYIISFLIGLASTGISLEETDSSMEDFDSRESSTLIYSDVSGDMVFSKESRILNPGSSVSKGSNDIPEATVPGTLGDPFLHNGSRNANSDSGDIKSSSGSEKMNVPVKYLKKIFLNNLGLNIIIIVGAFSMLAFSMIVLVFNALQVGMLVKGIYNSFGLKLAMILVMPHLVVEVISHILSLYLAYVILRQIIVPVVVIGKGIWFDSYKARNLLALLFLIVMITFIAAVVEIYVTPKLI